MLEALFNKYGDQGLLPITVLTGSGPEEVDEWVAEFGSTHPVLSDMDYVVSKWETDGGIPSHHLLSPGAVIQIIDGHVGEEEILEYLPE